MKKSCKKCNLDLPAYEFHKDAAKKDGLRAICRKCASSAALAWHFENQAKKSLRMAAYYESNRDKLHKASADWARVRSDIKNKANSKRRASLACAVPSWFGELDELVMSEAFLLSKSREAATGFKWHVDHIIPIAGGLVCGLHVHNNVAVIPAIANLRKSNKLL